MDNTTENLDPDNQSLWRMTKRVMSVPTPSSPQVTPGGIVFWVSEKAEALADSLGAQSLFVTDPSVPAHIQMVGNEPRAFSYVPSSESFFINPAEVQEALQGLKVGKATGPDRI